MERIFTNCSVVTRGEVLPGSVVVKKGLIKDVDSCRYNGTGSIDLGGDFLLPGLIEMHTDNLEKNIQPRPGVIWPSLMAATLAHDQQISGSGITTVYDAIAVGSLRRSDLRSKILQESVSAITRGMTQKLYKADHFVHLRCEVADSRMETMLNELHNCPAVKLVSIMDHTPGQRQWRDIAKWRLYHRDKKWSEDEVTTILANLREMQEQYSDKNRMHAIEFAKKRNIPLASHDDTTCTDAEIAARAGFQIAEFPTTMQAAAKANELGMKTILGAPNAIRGESHSGNISASILAENNLLDGLSSDYAPSSLLHSTFHLANTLHLPLHQTIAMASANVAEMVGLNDRGEIAPGKMADLLQVQLIDNTIPVVRKVWKRGFHVC